MKHHILILLCLVTLFTSCVTYQSFNIDVLEPAEYSMPPEIRSVVIVDQSKPYRDSLINKIEVENEVLYVDTIWNDDFSKLTIKSLCKELINRKFYDTVYIYNTQKSLGNNKLDLDWDGIAAICNNYNAEAVIVFDSYYYRSHINVNKPFEDVFYGFMDVNGGILWKAYDNINHTQMFSEVQVDTISWQVSEVSLNGVARQLPGFKEGYANLADYLGYAAANQTAPKWNTVNRGIYTSGNYQFMQAAEFLHNKKYGEAIKLWKFVYDKSKTRDKALASYNLAVISEIMNDFASAQYWINESYGFYENELKSSRFDADRKRTIVYMVELNKRVQSLDKLKEQIGGN